MHMCFGVSVAFVDSYLVLPDSSPPGQGWTPLMLAAHCGYASIAQELIGTHHADMSARTSDGRTALHISAESGRSSVMDEILKHMPADQKVGTET